FHRPQPGRPGDPPRRRAAMRVVIAEDEVLLRAGLRHVLDAGGIDVVATAADADELLALAAELRPDLVVTDIRMPPTNTDDGLRAAIEIRRHLDIAIVVLSQHLQRRYALELLADDPARIGYLLKQRIADIDAFTNDLRQVNVGATVLDPEVVKLM